MEIKKLKKQIMLCGHKEYYYRGEKADDICSRCERIFKRKVRMHSYAKQK
jgi:hypothetical protein|tara:strand:+ start:273 stop:422 length:150 start_codon:yes stop_codon:yes gene_type:complete